MTYDRTAINIERLETKIRQVMERKDLRNLDKIVSFLLRKIERIEN